MIKLVIKHLKLRLRKIFWIKLNKANQFLLVKSSKRIKWNQFLLVESSIRIKNLGLWCYCDFIFGLIFVYMILFGFFFFIIGFFFFLSNFDTYMPRKKKNLTKIEVGTYRIQLFFTYLYLIFKKKIYIFTYLYSIKFLIPIICKVFQHKFQ